MYVNMIKMLKDAENGGYAVGAFNIVNRLTAKAIVDQAVADGRIQASQKDQFLALMAKDFDGVKKLLEGMPKGSGRVSNFIGSAGGNTTARQQLEAMSWTEIDKAERLMELKNNYPDLYEAKYNEQFKN